MNAGLESQGLRALRWDGYLSESQKAIFLVQVSGIARGPSAQAVKVREPDSESWRTGQNQPVSFLRDSVPSSSHQTSIEHLIGTQDTAFTKNSLSL